MTPRDFVPCHWCGGGSATADRGCAACFNARERKIKELAAEYAAAFPNGPQPLLTLDNSPEGWDAMRRIIGKEAVEKAFGEGGGGISEIIANIEREKAG